MIGLQLFLYIGGYIQIGFIAFRLLITCCSYPCSDQERKKCLECVNCPQCLIAMFNMAWAGIGLYIYTQQMSTKCQKEQIGIMILSWSIIQFAVVVLMCLCLTCYCCYHGATFIVEAKKNCKCKCKCNQENAEEVATATLV
eukprot:UN09028